MAYGWADLASDALSGLGSYAGQSGANKRNLQIAREQMQFQERMSNTAVQRRMEDMRLGGINPLLAGKMEASSPAGAQATMQNAIGQGIQTGLQSASLRTQIKKANAEIQNINAGTEFTEAKTGVIAPTSTLMQQLDGWVQALLGDDGKGGPDKQQTVQTIRKNLSGWIDHGKQTVSDWAKNQTTQWDAQNVQRDKAKLKAEIGRQERKLSMYKNEDVDSKRIAQRIRELKIQLAAFDQPRKKQ